MTDQTDEDKLREKLLIHKNMIGWVIKKLRAEGVQCQRTTGNDPNGDILLINPDDSPKVREIVRQIQKQYNP